MFKGLAVFKKFQNRSKHDVFKNMAILASGAVVARIIGLGSTPILTRIYTPEHFGLLSVFMAALAMIIPFTTLRYSIAIPLLKNSATAMNLVVSTVIILCIVTVAVSIILGFFSSSIFELFSLNSIVEYWWLLPIAVFGSGMYEILRSWFTRQKEFKTLAKTDVYVTAGGALLKIGMGLMGLKPMGLLIGSVFTSIIGVVPLLLKSYSSFRLHQRFLRISRMKLLLKHYLEYPKYRLPSQFILALSVQAPLLILANFFGTDTVGQFSLALMVLSIPVSLLGTSMGQAYYAEIAKIGRKQPEKILDITTHITRRLFLFSIIPFFIILFFSPWLFSFIFGEIWRESGEFARLLSIYMLTTFISAPLVNALSVFEKQSLFLKLNIIRAGVLFMVFGMAYWLNMDSKETVLFYSIVLSIHYIYVSVMVFKVIRDAVLMNKKR